MKRRNLPPLLLLLWPYLLFLSAALPVSAVSVQTIFLRGYLLLTPVVYLGSIVFVCCTKEGSSYWLSRWDMWIKLAHIPFYLLVFGTGMLFLLSIAVPALTLFAPMLVFVLFLMDLALMLTTSFYGFRALRLARKAGIVSAGFASLHMVLHLIFVADVISAVLVCRRLKRASFS